MEFNDMMLRGVVNETRDKLHAMASDFSSEEDFLRAIDECKNTEEELKNFVTDDDDERVLHDYVTATIKMLQDLAFGIGIMMNGQEIIKSSFKKYDAACDETIKAIEDRSGSTCDNLVAKLETDHIQRAVLGAVLGAVFGAFLEAMTNADGDLPDGSYQNFVDTMKRLEEEKKRKQLDNEGNNTDEK